MFLSAYEVCEVLYINNNQLEHVANTVIFCGFRLHLHG